MTTQVQPPPVRLSSGLRPSSSPRRAIRYAAGVLLLAAAYIVAAKVGQTLRYTASVAAMWPPAGVGVAALYLLGMRWWPGVLIAECVVNAELLTTMPAGSLLGQQAGNMTEVIVGALLLRRFCGPAAGLDRTSQVSGMFGALAAAAAISASVGTLSMLAGGVVDVSEALVLWRTWCLGDLAGALVVVSVALTWSRAPAVAWRRLWTPEGALMVTAVAVLGALAVGVNEPLTYIVFPALIWAALRFGPPGAALAVLIASGLAIGITAAQVGPFFKQPIDHRTLGTQAYIVVMVLTTLILSAVVSERERSVADLTEAKLREGERTFEERRRIARELHDSVSQALFSAVLHTRLAQRDLGDVDPNGPAPLARGLRAIADLVRGAQVEMRALISELGRDPLAGGLVAALERHAATIRERDGVPVHIEAPIGDLALSTSSEAHLFGIGREALANGVKHAGASALSVRVYECQGRVVLEVSDDGCGFDTAAMHPGHFGHDSMRSRAAEIGALLTIDSTPGKGTVVRAQWPAADNPA